MALSQKQLEELYIAKTRVDAGTPGLATGNNAGDVANLKASGLSSSNLANLGNILKIGTGKQPETTLQNTLGGAGGTIPDTAPETTTPDVISGNGGYDYANEAAASIKEQKDLLAAERAMITESTNALIRSIESDYTASFESAKALQESEKKTESAIQYRLGQAGTGYGLAQTKKNDLARKAELEGLLAQKESLILKASSAARADDLKLVKQYTNEINDLDEKYYNRQREQRQDMIKEYIDLGTEERARRKEAMDFGKLDRENAQGEVEKMAAGGITSEELLPEEIDAYEESLGLLPGTFSGYYDSLVKATKAKSEKDDISFYNSLQDMLSKVPPGQMVQVGDFMYEGEEKPDIFQVKEEDAKGNVVAIGIDKITGDELWRQELGKIGKGFKATGTGISAPTSTAADLFTADVQFLIDSGATDAGTIAQSIAATAEESGINLSVKDLNYIRIKAEQMILAYNMNQGINNESNPGSEYTPDTTPDASGKTVGYIDADGRFVSDRPAGSNENLFKDLGITEQYTLDENGNVVIK